MVVNFPQNRSITMFRKTSSSDHKTKISVAKCGGYFYFFKKKFFIKPEQFY